jgi:hypothetical protein
MTSPLTRYVMLTHATYFILLLVPFALVALPVETDFHMVYLMILPLAAVGVVAFAGTLLLLSSRGELETLQVYGVADRSIGRPLAIATCAPLAAFSAVAIPLSSNPWNALLFAAIGFVVTISIPLVIVRRCWRPR